MRRAMNRKLLISGLATTLFVGAGALALGATGESPGSRFEPQSLPPRPPEVTAVEPELAESFGVLRDSAISDGSSSRLSSLVGDGPGRFFGANVELSRVSVTRGDETLYVIPGRGGLCLALDWSEGVNVGCADIARAKAGYTLTTVGTRSGFITYGLVPDEVSSITLRVPAGEDIRSDVVGNAYVVEASEPPTMLSYAAPNGRVDLPVPSLQGIERGP
jgi:hypothetical protein